MNSERDSQTVASQSAQISVIMPAYNEEEKIVESVRCVRAQLRKVACPYEIIVVDDGSTDGTRTEVRKLGMSDIKLVGYQNNQGKGFAIKWGAKYVTGDIVVFMDSDADVVSDVIGQYVSALRDSDIAVASKRHPNSIVSASVMRKFLSHAFHCLVVLLTGIRVSDTQSGLKAFRREAFAKTMALISVKRYAFDVELLTVARLLEMRVIELPVKIRLGNLFSVRQVLRMLVDVLGITYRLRVLRWYQKNIHNPRAKYDPIMRW